IRQADKASPVTSAALSASRWEITAYKDTPLVVFCVPLLWWVLFPKIGPITLVGRRTWPGGNTMAIDVICPNGHLLRLKEKYAGTAGLCPHCHARIQVPHVLRDEDILGLLGDWTPPPPEPSPTPAATDDDADVLSGDAGKTPESG